MLIFETERLIVRQYNLQDAGIFFLLNSNEEVMRYIRPVVSKEDSYKFLVQNIWQYADYPKTGRWAVTEKTSNCFVGSFSLLVMDNDKNKLHIGYALLPDFWGRGYASELLKQGIGYFFNNHPFDQLYAITEIHNVPSQKVLLKAGFLQTKSANEGEKEIYIYTINREEALKQL